MWIAIGLIALVAVLALLVAFMRGAHGRPTPEVEPLPAVPPFPKLRKPRGDLDWGPCPACGVQTYLRHDGQANRRFHVCREPAYPRATWAQACANPDMSPEDLLAQAQHTEAR